MSQLEGIKARVEKATPGPWQVWDDAPAHRSAFVETTWSTDGEHREEITDWCKPDDAEFIAHARTDIPKLIAALEAVEALLGEQDGYYVTDLYVHKNKLRQTITEALA